MRTIAQQRPPGWRQPPIWVPPAHFPAPSQPIQLQTRFNPLFLIAPFVLLLGTGVAVFVAAGASAIGPGQSRAVPAPLDRGSWDGKSTLMCGLDDHLVVENKTVTLDNQTVIQGSMNCTITIKNCTLKGATVVQAAANSRVTVVNSTLEGATAIKVGTNGHVTLEGSTIKATETALDGGMNAEVRIDKNSHVTSDETAIRLSQAAKLYIVKSSVEATETAIDTSQSCRVDARDSTIKGGETSLSLGQVSRLVLRNTKVEGKRKLSHLVRVDEH